MWNPKLFFPLFLFICGGVGASENSIFEHNPILNDLGEGLNNWMSFVEDGQQINKISIPGTHDTMSNGKHCTVLVPNCHRDWVNDGDTILLDYVQTQDLSLKAQLEMGIRYLDIRLRHYGNAFTIHHGPFYLSYNFDDVLGAVTSFLKKQPSETVIISYQEEHTAIPGGKSFKEVFNLYVKKPAYKQYIYGSTNQAVYNNVPTLKTVRGKIVFYNKGGKSGTLGLRSVQMKDNYDNIDVKTDAYYDELETHITQAMKWLNYASEQNLWITFLSANNAKQVGKGPREIAWFVNPQMEYRLKGLKDRAGSFGIVVMDYPSIDLIRVILKKNVMNGYYALLERILVPKTDRKYCAIHQGAGKEKNFYITLNGGQHQTKDPSSNQFKFAYVWVQKDCELTMYSDKSYQGYHQKIEYGSSWLSSSHWLGWWWQNDVRSYKCHCATYGRFNIQ